MPCHCEGCEWNRDDRERAAGDRSEGLPSAADESEAEGSRTVVGKPVVVPRPEPLAKVWGQGAPALPGCPRIVPLMRSPVDVRRKLGRLLPHGGGARGVAPGTGVCRVLTDVHWPGQVVAVGILGRSVTRVPRSRGISVVWQRFLRPGAVVGGALLPMHVSVGIWEQ